MSIQTVGVVGAGTMGSGVASALAQSGYGVVLVDVREEQLAAARRLIRENERVQALLGRRAARGEVLASGLRIRFSTDHELLGEADFVIENVTESWEIKEQLYLRLDEICPPRVPFAVNTSAIPITRVASVTRRAPQVIGMHFMNPPTVMPVVELIRGHHTSKQTLEQSEQLVRSMGKDCIVVEDSPGFVTNRVLMLTINEAIFLVHEGVASAHDVDRLFKTCFGHKMGPLETADLIGLDTVLYSLEVLLDEFADGKYRACPLLKRLVDAGLHGRKTGRGFYDYGLPSEPAARLEKIK